LASRAATSRVTSETTRPRRTPATRDALRLWLRLFTTTALIERRLGAALKREFGSSLPRFDLLAQLHRAPDGVRMTALAESLLVTGGNVTWLVRSLEDDGYVVRERPTTDKRAVTVRLTPAGRRHFATMADAHARWVRTLTRPLPPEARRALAEQLRVLKQHAHTLEDLS
jgi:DNA-binding MarR family transcriptional regulator